MALFKISKGTSASLNDQAKVPGYCWYTTDESMFYVDVDGSTRKALNAAAAQALLLPGAEGEGSTLITLGDTFDDSSIKISTNDLIKAYIDEKVMEVSEMGLGLSQRHITATEGQTAFNFGVRIGATNTLVYFNGLLLIEGVHYTVGGDDRNIIELLDWTAKADDHCHIVSFKAGGGFIGGEATATSADIMNGATAYGNEGELITGTFTIDDEIDTQSDIVNQLDEALS